MKALTLTQPWATLMAIGAKLFETRSWHTAYRGPLAIHAAKEFWGPAAKLCFEEPYLSALWGAGVRTPNDLPRGAIIAVVELVDCLGITANQMDLPFGDLMLPPPEPELSFGDYTPGRFAWVTEKVRRLKVPLPCRGALGLWEGPEITPDMF